MPRSRVACLAAIALSTVMCTAHAQSGKPTEIKVGISTFLSGPPSVFGVPSKIAADMYIEELNAAGGISGAKIVPTYIDEGVGTDKFLTEYRRVVQEENAKVMIAANSSGNCNALAPVAEDLKVVDLMWDCGAQKILEERRYRYTVRPQSNTIQDFTGAVVYLLRHNPNFKTVAVVNQDYAQGREAWDVFLTVLKTLKPDVKVVAELFPRFGATDYSTEISRLQALRPDVVFSAAWGGDLDTFVRQASQRGLMKNSQFVLPLAESSLERVGALLPDGVIVGARGDHYFLNPEFKNDPKLKAFILKYRQKMGAYPIYPVFHMIQALDATKAAYEKAMKANGGKWPTSDQVADALHKFTFQSMASTVTIREDGQGLEDELYGVTRKVKGYPFPIIDKIEIYPGAMINNPVGKPAMEWLKTVKPEMLHDSRIKTFPSFE
ncbi:ABC transporter substrate-binding protein [Pandoraea cepalis]|uniref:ABC transporter substrate-binding protein n=1 Tax=Pandoraea cepalis TaxID=2508294 RepID=A0A5E4VNV1_9BURK|nr:ABC transporter substrate-binding protein [Pandoraea cepalis]VVE13593.1 ABC transporter substrate-binding protein [Pandoraea cepalis]